MVKGLPIRKCRVFAMYFNLQCNLYLLKPEIPHTNHVIEALQSALRMMKLRLHRPSDERDNGSW